MQQAPASETSLSLKADIFLKNLKEATAPMHKALEQLPLSALLVSPAVTLDNYKNYLLHMLPVVKDVEKNIYPLVSTIVADVDQRRKLPLLLQDLTTLDAPTRTEDVWPLSAPMQSMSVAFAMGILYVMEGSTLGGRFIGNNLEQALHYTPGNGAAYFGGYGATTGTMWKRFLQNLVDFQASTNEGETIIEGARFAFTSIYNHFK